MLDDKLKYNLHLHRLVFIAGFTAILGELISIEAFSLVWYRMAIAFILMLLYIKWIGLRLTVSRTNCIRYLLAGIIIALH